MAAALALAASGLHALPTERYAQASALASGQWRKVSVDATGVCFVSAAQLKAWGIASPQQAVVAGYGAQRISDVLNADNYTDDLPEVQCERTPEGIWFYAVGPREHTFDPETGAVRTAFNPYTSKGYYFISQGTPQADIPAEGRAMAGQNPATTYTAVAWHEVDKTNYGSSGRSFFGEDFRFSRVRQFDIPLPGFAGGNVDVCATVAAAGSAPGEWCFAQGGYTVPGSDTRVAAATSSDYAVGAEINASMPAEPGKLTFSIAYTGGGNVSAANLDAIDVNYTRSIALDGGTAAFHTANTAVSLAGAGADTRVWDVTDPLRVKAMNTLPSGGAVTWVNDYTGLRRYEAWTPGAPTVALTDEGRVDNQNLHALATPDMVIITVPGLEKQAQRIADLHARIDSMTVAVVSQNLVFNEFASGAKDPGAYRRFLKMLYDRGASTQRTLKYALFLGRPTFDPREITNMAAVAAVPLMPSWQSPESLGENASYTTDDFFAFLEDNSGLRPGADTYSIAVGRIPAKSEAEAAAYIDKLEAYCSDNSLGEWRNRVILTADDGDHGVHLSQTEELMQAMKSGWGGDRMVYDKVYLDASPLVGGVCVKGRDDLHRLLNSGASWWTYTGHANKYYISAQGIMTLNDLNSLSNKRWPVFFGATCYFMQWDGPEQSGAEKMFFRRNGGTIANITATRPVFISENSMLSRVLGREAFATDDSGQQLPVGEILRRAKNQLTSASGTYNGNKLKYALMGDPALRPATGNLRIEITSINNAATDTTAAEDIVLPGHSTAIVSGRVVDADGRLADSFNGPLALTLYDAERSVTTIGRDIDGTTGRESVYDEHGDRLAAARDSVAGGQFTAKVTVPSELADNFRPALLSVNASGTGSTASGAFSGFYVYGSDENAAADTIAPVIESMYLNRPDFANGDKVSTSPRLTATVTDNTGINLSTAGIGRAMSLRLDGVTSLENVADYFTPSHGGIPGGTLSYPLGELSEGRHNLTYKVFDIDGNYAEATVDFLVDSSLDPEIYDVYTDANPAVIEANFYVSHNRPDEIITVNLAVYNLNGMLVWSHSSTDRSDMFTSAPVKWDLRDLAGRRVSRGIYIYRAEIRTDSGSTLSPGKKIAVAAP